MFLTQRTHVPDAIGRRLVHLAQLAAIIIAGLIIRLSLIQTAGYHDDVTIFSDWFTSIARLAPAQVYAQTPGLNYPPMAVVMYEVEAWVFHFFVHGSYTQSMLNVAVKLPAILMDAVGALLLYRIIRRYANHALALLGAAFFALNPATIYDSAFWGQNDAVPTVVALFALAELTAGSSVIAWIALTTAIFIKPPVLVLVPLLLLYPLRVSGAARVQRIRGAILGLIAAALVAEALAYAYFAHPSPLIATRHLIGQFINFSGIFNFNSLNAFNVWSVFQPFFVSDSTKYLGISMHHWSDLLFIATAGWIYWRYARSRSTTALFEAATLVLLAFFLLLTEMHERYMYYAVIFCGTLLFKPIYRQAALVLSITLLLNMEYGLNFMYLDDAKATMIDRFAFAPMLSHICALANLAVFGLLVRDFLREKAPVVPTIQPALLVDGTSESYATV